MSDLKTVGVIGAGTMGNGIAQVFAQCGSTVKLIDLNQDALDRATKTIDKSVNKLAEKGKIDAAQVAPILARISTHAALAAASDCDLVVEAVFENEAVKAKIFGELDDVCPPETILASNTSSISITRIAAATQRPEKVIGMHFMNPVPIMKLVEVIRGHKTSSETTAAVVGACEALGKTPLEAEDYPGFVANRILMPMINEACFALMEGVATREAIDGIMKLGCAHPMGPLTLADFIGLDICLNILNVLHGELGDPKYRPCPLLARMVAAGDLGRKSGRGFYDYAKDNPMSNASTLNEEARIVNGILADSTLEIQRRTREIAQQVIAPNAARYDEEGVFPEEAIDALNDVGYMSMIIPKEHGGFGGSNVDLCAMLIEVNKVCASAGVICSVHNSLCVYPIKTFASEEIKQKYLPKLASCELLGGYCLTEPEAGSDAANQRTTAVRDGEDFVLNGSKIFITTGKEAGLFIVFARTSKEDKPAKGISCFVVEASTPGLTVGKTEIKMGIKASSTTEIHFDNCRVPAANLIGEPGRGFNIAMEILNGGRVGIACQGAGIHGGIVEELDAFIKSEKRNGKPLAYQQDVAWTMSELIAEYDASEALIYRAACARDREPNPIRECSTAKLFSSQACNRAGRRAMQIMGLKGAVRGNRVERFYRDARITEIYEGTSEVQKIVIARTI